MKVVFVVGPTASGKSTLSLNLAEAFGGAILNADSIQIYQELLIGAASPSIDEKSRVPHFLFQVAPPPQRLTAGDFSRMALEQLEQLKSKFPVVFVTGGTGFYLMALEKGMLPIEKADAEIQAQLEEQLQKPGGEQVLHEQLCLLDPVAGRRISLRDHYRLVRALEIMQRTGRKISEIELEHKNSSRPFPYPLLKLGVKVERDDLRSRIVRRTQGMLEQGLIEEVASLIEKGYLDWEPLQSVGYKEAVGFLHGLDEVSTPTLLEEKIVQNTMRLAKKQKTWFQRDPEIHWAAPGAVDFFKTRVAEFLSS